MLLSQLAVFLFASLVTAKAHHPRTSPGLCVEYSCPDMDLGEWQCDPSGPNTTGEPGLYCDFPPASEAYGLFYCIYDPTTGGLILDSNDGLCQETAVAHQGACSSRRARKRSPSVSPRKIVSAPNHASKMMARKGHHDGNKKVMSDAM